MSTEHAAVRTSHHVARVAIAIVLVLCLTRLAGLGARLPHHDEMVHLSMSETLAFEGTYQASPIYHGPLLYHLEATVVRVLGSVLWQARLVAALAGIAAALALVVLAWRESGRRTALVVAVLVTLSPSWVYYSRFNAHDTLILLMTVLVAWGRWHWMRGQVRTAAWLIVLALALAWSTKLNALFIVGAIALWPAVWRIATHRVVEAHGSIARPRPPTLVAPLVTGAAVVGALFLTTFQAHLAEASGLAALTATLRAAVTDPVVYWAGLHQQQRLGGPFHYYGALLALYEPLLVAGSGLAVMTAWREAGRSWKVAAAALATGALLGAAVWPFAPVLRSVLHLHPVHVVVLPAVALALWTLLRVEGRRLDDSGVWWAWMAATQTLLYSYAGEKVPWLTVHVALPWMMVAAPALERRWSAGRTSARSVLVVLALLTGYGALAVSTWTRSDVAEPLVQLEYAPDTHALLGEIATTCGALALHDEPCLVTTPDAAWPARWYLRAMSEDAVAEGAAAARATTPFIFLPARSRNVTDAATPFAGTHTAHPARFAAWGTWVDWLHRPQPADLLRFWLLRRSLGPRRGVPYELWVRRDLARTGGGTLNNGSP